MISPWWLLVEGAYIGGSIALLLVAFKAKSEWVKAALGAFAVATLAWRLLAVVPSWWLYFAEGELEWGGQGCVALDASCLKQSVKDTIVVIENAIVLAGFVVAFLMWQKRFPKQLASGESKSEATGGYK